MSAPAPSNPEQGIIDAVVLKQNLEFLLRHLGPLTIVTILPDLGRVTGHWTQEADSETLQWITRHNLTDRNVYFSLNQPLPKLDKKASKAEITHFRAACADIDAKSGRSMDDCLAAIEQLPLPPSFIIMTGGGYQPIWLIEPLPASPETQARVEAVGRAISTLTGGDQVQNVDRILRVPATINHPNKIKRAAGRTRVMAEILDPPDPVVRYSLERLESAFLTAAAASGASGTRENRSRRPRASAGGASLGPKPKHLTGDEGIGLNAALREGVLSFANLPAGKQNAMLVAMLEMPAIKTLADEERPEWLRVLFALADAEHQGATEARALALEWSKSSKRFKNEADFNRDWNSFDPARPVGITVATLLARARDAGFDLSAWLDTGDPGNAATAPPPPASPSEPGADAVIHMPIRFSENALAYIFTNEHAENLLYVHLWGTWLFWRSGRWCVDHTVKVFDAARTICAREGRIAETSRQNGRQIANQINKAGTVAAIERLARHHHRHVREVEQFDADPMLLNTPDSTLDLRDHNTPKRAHRRDNYLTRTTTVAAAETADCPLWKEFLLRIMGGDPDMVAYLHRVCGYMLTGHTSEHAMFFGYGPGANGKSTFASVLLGILNADQHGYAAVAAISTFTASLIEQHPTDLAMLRGKRCVVAQETEAGRAWAVAKLKMMTGGDRITARLMRQDFFTYEPQFKLLILGNHKPALGSVDEAIRRRINMIPFVVEIPVQDRDRELGNKLKAEYPQILRWMIEGCAIWQRESLKPPAKVIAATETYLANEDNFGTWLEECCEIGPAYTATLAELFGSWKAWSWRNGEPEARRKVLSNALDGHSAFKRGRDSSGHTAWSGLRLKSVTPAWLDEIDDEVTRLLKN